MATLDLARSPLDVDVAASAAAEAADAADEARLRADSRGMEALLAEAQAMSSPEAWARVTEAIRRLVELYGRGLVRAVGHARHVGGDDAGFQDAYDARLAGDELVASLLVMHGAHPQSCEDRIRAALAKLAIRLGGVAQLAALDADGVAYVRLGPCEIPAEQAADAIRRSLEQVAPELSRIRVRVEAA